VAVAATDNTDALASFSDFGATSVHLGAPGVNVLSLGFGGNYGHSSGTSMATPHVSGSALLILSACSLNTADLKAVVLNNVDPVPSLTGITITGGRLNVNKAIRACSGAPTTLTSTLSAP
jgi:subtilisin family serine protease